MEGPLFLFVNAMGGIAILYAVIKISEKAKMLDKLTILLAVFTIIICLTSIILGLTGIMKITPLSSDLDILKNTGEKDTKLINKLNTEIQDFERSDLNV